MPSVHPETRGLSERDRKMMGLDPGMDLDKTIAADLRRRGGTDRYRQALQRKRLRNGQKKDMLAWGSLTSEDREMIADLDRPLFKADPESGDIVKAPWRGAPMIDGERAAEDGWRVVRAEQNLRDQSWEYTVEKNVVLGGRPQIAKKTFSEERLVQWNH